MTQTALIEKMILVALSFTLFVSQATYAEQAESYQSCIACHGDKAQGNKAMNAPALAGQNADYLKQQLSNFKQGYRGKPQKEGLTDSYGSLMAAQATALDSGSIDKVSKYISNLPKASLSTSITGDATKGKQYYDGYCGACHGPAATGNPLMNAPKLSGMQDWYIKRQIQNFQQGTRGYHSDDKLGRQMKMMSGVLPTPQSIDDVLAYFNSLN